MSTSWTVRRIDPVTWNPMGYVDGVKSVSIRRSTGKDAPLMESADMETLGVIEEGYYRVEARSSTGVMTPVVTMLFNPESLPWSGGRWGGRNSGRSVLAPASERRFAPGDYAPMGVDGAAWVAHVLRDDISAPVEADGSFVLGDDVVFDSGDSHLDGAWKVLDSVGWCLRISGRGEVTVTERQKVATLRVSESSGILMPGLTYNPVSVDVPNVLKVYEDGRRDPVIARNDDPESPTSTVARGREIEEVEDNPTKRDGETTWQYSQRRLAELSEEYETMEVERTWVDGADPYAVWEVNLPRQGIAGLWRVTDQSIECSGGMTVGETWGKVR